MVNGRYHLFSEVKAVLRKKKLRWLFGFAATQVVPFLEVALLSCIYLILEPGKREKVLAILGSLNLPFLDVSTISESEMVTAIFITGLLLLLCSAGLRYINEVNLIKLRYYFYVRDSQKLLHYYLDTCTTQARATGKERIIDSIMRDCGVLAENIKLSLEITGALFSMLLYIIGAAVLSWKMLLVACVIYAVPLWINRHVFRRMQDIGQLKMNTQEGVLKYFSDILMGFERSKIDGLESPLKRRSESLLKKSQEWRIRKRKTEARLRVANDGLTLLGLLVVLFVGVVYIKLQLAILMTLFVIFNRLKVYVELFSKSYLQLRERIPSLHRYYDLLSTLGSGRKHGEKSGTDKRASVAKIEMKGVYFRYNDEPVLSNINFEARAGDRILIKGPSGHGKTTFLEILCGILPPTEGSVLYDGMPLNEELFYDIRPYITYVSPTVYLFQDTLKMNLLIGCPEKENQLEKAISLAGLSNVVSELPKGLDTYIGTDGDALSLGQRQRVILARLYLKDPRIILFDEATANLDKQLEKDIIDNLASYISPESIVIMVAHKEPPNMNFNKRFKIENGTLEDMVAEPIG